MVLDLGHGVVICRWWMKPRNDDGRREMQLAGR